MGPATAWDETAFAAAGDRKPGCHSLHHLTTQRPLIWHNPSCNVPHALLSHESWDVTRHVRCRGPVLVVDGWREERLGLSASTHRMGHIPKSAASQDITSLKDFLVFFCTFDWFWSNSLGPTVFLRHISVDIVTQTRIYSTCIPVHFHISPLVLFQCAQHFIVTSNWFLGFGRCARVSCWCPSAAMQRLKWSWMRWRNVEGWQQSRYCIWVCLKIG